MIFTIMCISQVFTLPINLKILLHINLSQGVTLFYTKITYLIYQNHPGSVVECYQHADILIGYKIYDCTTI